MSTLDFADFRDLLGTGEAPELGPGPRAGVQPEAALRQALDQRFRGADLLPDRERLVRALVLLWHDHLEAAHEIAQGVPSADGAFVHGIMHRREPDYGNAQYWFRRVGEHPAFREIAALADSLSALKKDPALKAALLPGGEWDAMEMIAACERAARGGDRGEQNRILREVQRVETEGLMTWLLRQG